MSLDAFGVALDASVAHASNASPGAPLDVERYIASLHLEDLALAVACAAGHEDAWDHFVREFRPALYRAADAIDPSGGARELADSLYADLYGLATGSAERRSLFRYFHGRSRLTTWLRSVLAQRCVDRIRALKHLEPLPDEDAPGTLQARSPRPAAPSRWAALLQQVLAMAMAALSPRDRLRLSLYYIQGATLAAIGRVLGEHEATVSRHLTRTRRELREGMEHRLRRDHHLDNAAIDECFKAVMDDPGTMDLERLVGAAETAGGKK